MVVLVAFIGLIAGYYANAMFYPGTSPEQPIDFSHRIHAGDNEIPCIGGLPTRIEWQASDAQDDAPAACQSVMLSLWDSEKKTSVAIDLWTKDTTIDDMNLHFFQLFHKMADTYLRATKNANVADLIHDFGNGFGKKLGLR